jgi:aspartate 1-decarboxylase
MERTLLKSKIHRAVITDANVNYEGSITIPEDLMLAADLWEGERVLVASITTGARLETYVIPGPVGSRAFVINGGAAHLIQKGHRVTILAYAQSRSPIVSRRLLMNEENEVIQQN